MFIAFGCSCGGSDEPSPTVPPPTPTVERTIRTLADVLLTVDELPAAATAPPNRWLATVYFESEPPEPPPCGFPSLMARVDQADSTFDIPGSGRLVHLVARMPPDTAEAHLQSTVQRDIECVEQLTTPNVTSHSNVRAAERGTAKLGDAGVWFYVSGQRAERYVFVWRRGDVISVLHALIVDEAMSRADLESLAARIDDRLAKLR